jgi:hypothetical protein
MIRHGVTDLPTISSRAIKNHVKNSLLRKEFLSRDYNKFVTDPHSLNKIYENNFTLNTLTKGP